MKFTLYYGVMHFRFYLSYGNLFVCFRVFVNSVLHIYASVCEIQKTNRFSAGILFSLVLSAPQELCFEGHKNSATLVESKN
jgi:hypothetical protein